MLTDRLIKASENKLHLEKHSKDIYKVYYPFYHEDGDMYDIFLRITDQGRLELCDMGATLMRLSYDFELNSDTRIKILGDILQANCIENTNGNLHLSTTERDFLQNLLSFSLTVSKIVSMDILKRENVYGLFIEQVREYITDRVQHAYKVSSDVEPIKSLPYKISYELTQINKTPIFLSAINSTLQAVRTTAVYSQLRQSKRPCITVAVHENFDSLASIDRNAITNATDNQYTSFHDFQSDFESYLEKCA